MSKLQAHHCVTSEQWTWLLCIVDVIPANILLLQEIDQLIGVELLTSGFLENFGFVVAISREGQMLVFLTYHELKTVCLSPV